MRHPTLFVFLSLSLFLIACQTASPPSPARITPTFTPVPTTTPTPSYPIATAGEVDEAMKSMMEVWGRCSEGVSVEPAGRANAVVNQAMEEGYIKVDDVANSKKLGSALEAFRKAEFDLKAICGLDD